MSLNFRDIDEVRLKDTLAASNVFMAMLTGVFDFQHGVSFVFYRPSNNGSKTYRV